MARRPIRDRRFRRIGTIGQIGPDAVFVVGRVGGKEIGGMAGGSSISRRTKRPSIGVRGGRGRAVQPGTDKPIGWPSEFSTVLSPLMAAIA